MKTVLITGAGGFIGKHLLEAMRGIFHLVVADRGSGTDLCNAGALDRVEESVDAVVHLAGRTFVPESHLRPHDFHHVNIMSALTVAEWCRRRKVRRVINFNTYPYGTPQRLPVDEEHPIALPSPYHRSKMLAEELLRTYFANDVTEVVALRIFNIYGAGQDQRFLIPSLVCGACGPRRVQVRDLAPKRDYLHVSDMTALVLKILETATAAHGVYNVGSGESHSVLDLIRCLENIVGAPIAVVESGERRPNEIMDCVADISKVSHTFRWRPVVGLEKGLRLQIAQRTLNV